MSTAFRKKSSVIIEEDVVSSNTSEEENNSEAEVNSNSNDSLVEDKVDDESDDDLDENDDESNDEDDNSDENIDGDDENDSNDESKTDANLGWADSMAKILKIKKPDGKSLILSKAKKVTDIKKKPKENVSFEIVQNEKDKVKTEDSTLNPDEDEGPSSKKRKESFPQLRVKPKIMEKNREKLLSKIATKGVVQLFNAVRTQQKDIETKLNGAGATELKKDKILKTLDKSKFLDNLSSQGKKEVRPKKEVKDEIKEEKEKSKWNVFRDDFMGSAKLKDWDKKEEKSDEDEDMSDSSENNSE